MSYNLVVNNNNENFLLLRLIIISKGKFSENLIQKGSIFLYNSWTFLGKGSYFFKDWKIRFSKLLFQYGLYVEYGPTASTFLYNLYLKKVGKYWSGCFIAQK